MHFGINDRAGTRVHPIDIKPCETINEGRGASAQCPSAAGGRGELGDGVSERVGGKGNKEALPH